MLAGIFPYFTNKFKDLTKKKKPPGSLFTHISKPVNLALSILYWKKRLTQWPLENAQDRTTCSPRSLKLHLRKSTPLSTSGSTNSLVRTSRTNTPSTPGSDPFSSATGSLLSVVFTALHQIRYRSAARRIVDHLVNHILLHYIWLQWCQTLLQHKQWIRAVSSEGIVLQASNRGSLFTTGVSHLSDES